jgi:hypothetical protein
VTEHLETTAGREGSVSAYRIPPGIADLGKKLFLQGQIP